MSNTAPPSGTTAWRLAVRWRCIAPPAGRGTPGDPRARTAHRISVRVYSLEVCEAGDPLFSRGGKSVGKSKRSGLFIGEVGGHRLRQIGYC